MKKKTSTLRVLSKNLHGMQSASTLLRSYSSMTTSLYFIGGGPGFKPYGQKFVVLLNEKKHTMAL